MQKIPADTRAHPHGRAGAGIATLRPGRILPAHQPSAGQFVIANQRRLALRTISRVVLWVLPACHCSHTIRDTIAS
nr:MAG TPA: hypothetical protein [Caudoviricetes sp.]